MLKPKGFQAYFFCAEQKGYSGVAVYCRRKPDAVKRGFGVAEFDAEGRYLELRFGGLTIVSMYLPSGSSSEERLAAKFRFLDCYLPHLNKLKRGGREVLLCGDWNIAHQEIDLKNWRSNQKNPGFLPEERAWLSSVFDQAGYVDVFRRLDRRPEQYTWWSNRGQARANNVGWRLDYHIATAGLAARAKRAVIHSATRFSDHVPVAIDYDWSLASA
jgi:exodeoxyribonuclease-3